MSPSWKERLNDRIPESLGREIDVFETQLELRRQGKMDERVFAETRLRRGVYGQRYDNGQRHDGVSTRRLDYPCGSLTKGPDTVWDAPGMVRIKIPMGQLSPEQLEVIAELAEEYSDAILHVTTRQDIQLHFVHLEDTPALMRRLAAVGITTQEACGNSVRNVTACQFAGVCNDQSFDVTPYAAAITQYLLGHEVQQDFGRKFKIAFSGCKDHPCGLANFHDLGAIAVVRDRAGEQQRGFEVYVGGGLGAVPHKAKVLDEFVPEAELLPVVMAVCRVFARLGEKQNRARARLKFVVQKLGIDEFRRVVAEERALLAPDPRWSDFLAELHAGSGGPLRPGRDLEVDDSLGPAFRAWHDGNVRPQAQPGYAVATVRLSLGDFTSDQARALAALARRYTGDGLRLTVEQNLVFRWLVAAELPAFHAELEAIGLGKPGASSIVDVTSCPGTDTCKLGISSSRGLSAVLESHLVGRGDALDPAVRGLHIKASGCFNSCGQHHVADIGFLGVSRNVGGRRVAHFQLVVGGQWDQNGGAYGLAIGAFPSRRIPELVDRLTALYVRDRQPGERFSAFVQRIGRAAVRDALDDLRHVPGYDEDRSFYTDWGDAREYTIGDLGVGECAGEVITGAQFGLAASEREVFEAQLSLEAGDSLRASSLAYSAMIKAARALLRVQLQDVSEAPDEVVAQFRSRLYDTKLFHDPYAGGKFASYLFRAAERGPGAAGAEEAHRRIEEAQLFIEAAHACHDRLQQQATAAPAQAAAS
jgi:sulfite reductase (ferredoxin)